MSLWTQSKTVLGHLVDVNGVQPDPARISAINNFPVPRFAKSVQSFIRQCSYFQGFVKNFAHIARPLMRLLKKDVPFSWGSEEASAFSTLVALFTTPPMLAHFNPAAPTEIRTDASGHGIGVVLAQKQHGHDCVIAYASRLLSAPERNYSITERECLALVWAVAKFRPYLYGRPFSVVTDHHALCWLNSLKDPSGRLGRWALRLQEFSYSVVYKSGHLHRDADCLSRYPVDDPEDTDEPTENSILSVSDFLNIGEEQKRDPELLDIISRMESSTNDASVRYFVIQKGVLYRRNFRLDGPDLLIVVPKHLRRCVLTELHDAPTAGHLGVSRTYERVRRRFSGQALLVRYADTSPHVTYANVVRHRRCYPLAIFNQLTYPRNHFTVLG
uniref:RNA-directed DNA polymerase n=1 Tax=Rhipicephalus microplus TaxID=6941 RepID=A0A6G5ABQ2_RHIMP